MARKRVERNISFDDVRKVYYVSMDLGKNSEGKRVKQYRTFPNLTSARTGLREFYADRDKLLHPPKQEQTLRQWLDYWMENIIRPNRAETTVYAYQKIIDNHLDPLLGAVPLSKLSPKQIQEYYQTMTRTEGLSSNTIRRHHDLLSAALRMAVRQDMLRVNPMERVEPPRPKLHEASYYTQENLKVLYQLVEGHWLEMVVKVTAGLGLRREEICGLKWESVDFQRRVVHIKEARTAYGATVVQKETKNRSSMRTLFMPDELYELLRRGEGPAGAGAGHPGRGLRRLWTCGAGQRGTALLPQRPVPGLHPVRAEEPPSPAHPPWTAPHLRHHRLCPRRPSVRHRQSHGTTAPPPPPAGSTPTWWTAPMRRPCCWSPPP